MPPPAPHLPITIPDSLPSRTLQLDRTVSLLTQHTPWVSDYADGTTLQTTMGGWYFIPPCCTIPLACTGRPLPHTFYYTLHTRLPFHINLVLPLDPSPPVGGLPLCAHAWNTRSPHTYYCNTHTRSHTACGWPFILHTFAFVGYRTQPRRYPAPLVYLAHATARAPCALTTLVPSMDAGCLPTRAYTFALSTASHLPPFISVLRHLRTTLFPLPLFAPRWESYPGWLPHTAFAGATVPVPHCPHRLLYRTAHTNSAAHQRAARHKTHARATFTPSAVLAPFPQRVLPPAHTPARRHSLLPARAFVFGRLASFLLVGSCCGQF